LYTLTAIKIFNIFASEHYGKTYVILEQLWTFPAYEQCWTVTNAGK
jgi:hypothetical protein